MSSNSSQERIFKTKAMFLGDGYMGEINEGQNGSDLIQEPLRNIILKSGAHAKLVDISLSNDFLFVNFNKRKTYLKFPLGLLAYCGAMRQLPFEQIKNREFETLDIAPSHSDAAPPLFVVVFRSLETENRLHCYAFMTGKDQQSMDLVKNLMEQYYNLIQKNLSEDEIDGK